MASPFTSTWHKILEGDSNTNANRYGIDLGTTFSCVCILQRGESDKYEAVTYNDSSPSLASVVLYKEQGSKIEIIAGNSAVHNLSKNIKNTVYDSKRFIGISWDDETFQKDLKNWRFDIENVNGVPTVMARVGKKTIPLTAEDVSAEVLKALKKAGDERCGNNPNKASGVVITVPAYFKNQQRKKTLEAAKKANLKVIQLINEPTSAAIAYAYQSIDHSKLPNKVSFLVYDYGGGTFDVSIVTVDRINREVVVGATGGDNHLGGQDVDLEVAKYFANLYKEKEGIDLIESRDKKDVTRYIKLRQACQEAKIFLVDQMETPINCDFLEDAGVDITMSRVLFNRLCDKYFQKTIQITKDVLAESPLKENDIYGIVLVGGSSRILRVQELLHTAFPRCKILKDLDVQTIVAMGASIVANECQDLKIRDVISHGLSTDCINGKSEFILPKFSPIPSTLSKTFATSDDNQATMPIYVYEGDKEYYSENDFIGGEEFQIPKKPAGQVKVKVTYHYDESGVLTVTMENLENGDRKKLDFPLKCTS